MGYIRAEDVFPSEVLALIQEYVDGQMLYIPAKTKGRNKWGSMSGMKEYLKCRNSSIYEEYQAGMSIQILAEKYFLSEKSIQRIIRDSKLSKSKVQRG